MDASYISDHEIFTVSYLKVSNIMHSYGGLLVLRGSKLELLKSAFNAENFIRRLFWSVSNDFSAGHS